MNIIVKEITEISDEILDILENLEKEIFAKPYSRDKLEQEIKSKINFILLIAFVNGSPVGYKAVIN